MNMLGTHDTERILNYTKESRAVKNSSLLQMTIPGVHLYIMEMKQVKGGKDPDNRKPYPWGKENIEVINIYKSFVVKELMKIY